MHRQRTSAWLTFMCCSTTMQELREAVLTGVSTLSLVTDAGNVRRLDDLLREAGQPVADFSSGQRRADQRRHGLKRRGNHGPGTDSEAAGNGDGEHASELEGPEPQRRFGGRRRRRCVERSAGVATPAVVPKSPSSSASSPTSDSETESDDRPLAGSAAALRPVTREVNAPDVADARSRHPPAPVTVTVVRVQRADASGAHWQGEDVSLPVPATRAGHATVTSGSDSDCSWSPSRQRGLEDDRVGRQQRVKRGPFSRVVDAPTNAAARELVAHEACVGTGRHTVSVDHHDGPDLSDADPASEPGVLGRPALVGSRRGRRHATLAGNSAPLLARFTHEELLRRRSWVRRYVVCRRGVSRLVVCSGHTGAIVSYVALRGGASAAEVDEAAAVLVDSVAAKLVDLTLPMSRPGASGESPETGDIDDPESEASRSVEDGLAPDNMRLLRESVQLFRPFGDYTRYALPRCVNEQPLVRVPRPAVTVLA